MEKESKIEKIVFFILCFNTIMILTGFGGLLWFLLIKLIMDFVY